MRRDRLYQSKGLALIAVAILFIGGVAQAQDTIAFCAYTFPPYSYKSTNGTYQGADIEITEAIFKRLGYAIKWIDLPFNRALDGVRKGTVAGIAPCVASEARKVFTIFSSIPTAALDRIFFKRKDRDLSWKTYEDLRGLTVGACDYSYPQHFWDAGKTGLFSIEVIKNSTPDLTNFKKLILGRIDMLIVDRAVGTHIIRVNAPSFDDIEAAPEVSVDEAPVPFSFGLSKRYCETHTIACDKMLTAYEGELDAYIKTGERNTVFTKYGISYRLDDTNHIIMQ